MSRFRRAIIVLAILALLFWWLRPGAGPSIEPESILVVNLEGSYVESNEAPLLSRLTSLGPRPLISVLSELRKAERDDRIAAVMLRIRDLQVGWGKAQELRAAIRRLGDAGKPTLAYLEVQSFGANLEYFVATGARSIHVSPGTRAPLVGLAAEYLFLGGLWERVGIDFEIEKIGRYKTATESIAGREMSDANREMANALLDSVDTQFVGGIAEGRGLDAGFVRKSIDSAPVTPEEMKGLGLIDGVSFYDEALHSLGEGPAVMDADYAAVDPSQVGFAPQSHFALIYGSGAVVMGRGNTTPTGGEVMASDTLVDAFDEAASDSRVSAIVFRVDSPGGSALASDVVWRAIARVREAGKPVIASFSDVAASGGYYAACGADAIVADGASLTGSIGVFVLRPVLRGLLDKLDIGVATLTRGRHAEMLLASQPLSEESRSRLRLEVQSIYDLFVSRVADGRSLSPEAVDAVGRGRVWTGQQAVEIGLIDEVGGLTAAVNRGKRLLHLAEDADVALIPFPAPKTLADQMADLLRRAAVWVAPELPFEGLARRLEPWLSASLDAPALLPPFAIEIH